MDVRYQGTSISISSSLSMTLFAHVTSVFRSATHFRHVFPGIHELCLAHKLSPILRKHHVEGIFSARNLSSCNNSAMISVRVLAPRIRNITISVTRLRMAIAITVSAIGICNSDGEPESISIGT